TRGQIQTLDIIDIDASNQQATIVGDLCDPTTLADHGPYDCVLAPQTLQYVDDPQRAVANMYAALDEGGILLLTVPAITRLDPDLATVDRWRWTELGITDLVQRMVPDADTQVDGHGNPVVALAFLMGIATEELRSSELDHFDQNFPIVVTAAIIKPHRP
ncbi:MAG: hypothetical protein QOI47_484, partial [Actinomycetota bacterium]|nr:hypothetical protein [Actinomycetota bacterium]